MNLKRPLPPNRSFEQVKNHYLVEKAIAEKLMKSNREERTIILSTMYDELFSKVPDHPRLTRRESPELTLRANKSRLSVLSEFLNKTDTYLEFAPGDSRFAFEVAKQVKYAYGVDISDQSNQADSVPDNFKLIIYDGYDLEKIESNSIDLVFSDQLIEHFHPEDTKHHFKLVHRILKVGGKYVFRTPHPLTGPHDVSKFFSDEPECFHLKEWTHNEIKRMVMGLEFSKYQTYWNAKGINLRIPYTYFALCELILGNIPKKYARLPTKYLIPSLIGVAIK